MFLSHFGALCIFWASQIRVLLESGDDGELAMFNYQSINMIITKVVESLTAHNNGTPLIWRDAAPAHIGRR